MSRYILAPIFLNKQTNKEPSESKFLSFQKWSPSQIWDINKTKRIKIVFVFSFWNHLWFVLVCFRSLLMADWLLLFWCFICLLSALAVFHVWCSNSKSSAYCKLYCTVHHLQYMLYPLLLNWSPPVSESIPSLVSSWTQVVKPGWAETCCLWWLPLWLEVVVKANIS